MGMVKKKKRTRRNSGRNITLNCAYIDKNGVIHKMDFTIDEIESILKAGKIVK